MDIFSNLCSIILPESGSHLYIDIPSTCNGLPNGIFGISTACHDTLMDDRAKSYTNRYCIPDRSD